MAWAAILSGLAIWLVERHWSGLGNDGALYTLLAFDHLDPATFGQDLLVRYGSQDPFTLFPVIYAAAIARLGLTGASLTLLLGAYGVWLFGAWRLTHALARGWPAHLAFVVVTAAPLGYGAWESFGAGESVLTPRPWAEGFSLVALAWLIGGQRLKSAAAYGLAILFHPAVALAGVVAGFLFLALRKPILWLAAPAGALIILGLALAGISPFKGLLSVMDPAWLGVVKARTAYVFLSSWLPGDYVRTACDASLGLAAALLVGGGRRRAFIAVTLAALAGIALTGLGADLFHDTLIIQLQTWRAAWLLAIVKWPAVALVWMRLRHTRPGTVAAALLTAPALIAIRPFADQPWAWGPAAVMSLAGLTLTALIVHGRAPPISPTVRRLAIEAALVLPIACLGDQLLSLGMDVATWMKVHAFVRDPAAFLPVRIALAGAGAGVVWLAARRAGAALALGLSGLALAGIGFDNRGAWERWEMSASPPLALPPGAQVIWDSEATPTWILLRRPDYFSAMQASGLALSRGAADEWVRRRAAMREVMPLTDFRLDYKVSPCSAPVWRANLAGVADACRRAPALAGVVVDRPLDPAMQAPFSTPVPMSRMCGAWPNMGVKSESRFYYLACDRLKAAP